MYLQITNRCNMQCAHCCFSCTERGEDMSLPVFENKIIEADYGHITLGGGEPTLHPQFWKMLQFALAHSESVFVSTNGSDKDATMALLKLAHNNEHLIVQVSIDAYHEPIDEQVEKQARLWGMARDTTRIIPVGRASNWGDAEGCICDLFITPSGEIYTCGCKTKRLNSVSDYKNNCKGVSNG